MKTGIATLELLGHLDEAKKCVQKYDGFGRIGSVPKIMPRLRLVHDAATNPFFQSAPPSAHSNLLKLFRTMGLQHLEGPRQDFLQMRWLLHTISSAHQTTSE